MAVVAERMQAGGVDADVVPLDQVFLGGVDDLQTDGVRGEDIPIGGRRAPDLIGAPGEEDTVKRFPRAIVPVGSVPMKFPAIIERLSWTSIP